MTWAFDVPKTSAESVGAAWYNLLMGLLGYVRVSTNDQSAAQSARRIDRGGV